LPKSNTNNQSHDVQYELNGIEEEDFDENGLTLTATNLADLNNRHDVFADELEKIKQLYM
jgi:hypothetical protein